MKPIYPGGRFVLLFVSALLLLAVSNGITNDKPPAADMAIKGYDPVAYFLVGKAVKGDQSFSAPWHNVTWYFQNKQHLDLFLANPEKYAPQFDGFCAWAMTENRKAVTDPEVWKIVNDKLYLNCSWTAYEKWSRDIPGNIKKAEVNWKNLTGGN